MLQFDPFEKAPGSIKLKKEPVFSNKAYDLIVIKRRIIDVFLEWQKGVGRSIEGGGICRDPSGIIRQEMGRDEGACPPGHA
jgi:hypothetical protein